MQCRNNFCIYCDDEECILDKVSLDNLGMCIECIQVNITEDILKAQKRKILDGYEKDVRKLSIYNKLPIEVND